MPNADCVFCDLFINGKARWVVRDGPARAFLPRPHSQLAPGHTLVVPHRHVLGFLDADDETLAVTAAMVKQVARAMTVALGATGVNVLNASGPNSGQSVDHLHFHVVPRWADDRATMWPVDISAHELSGEVHELIAAAVTR